MTPDPLLTATLLALVALSGTVFVVTLLRVLPHAVSADMARLRDRTEHELLQHKLRHGRAELTQVQRLVTTRVNLVDELREAWTARLATTTAENVPDQPDTPAQRRVLNRLEQVDRDLARIREHTRQHYQGLTEDAITRFNGAVRRLWTLVVVDIVLCVGSAAILAHTSTTLLALV